MQISSTIENVGLEALDCEYYVLDYTFIFILIWSIFDWFINQRVHICVRPWNDITENEHTNIRMR